MNQQHKDWRAFKRQQRERKEREKINKGLGLSQVYIQNAVICAVDKTPLFTEGGMPEALRVPRDVPIIQFMGALENGDTVAIWMDKGSEQARLIMEALDGRGYANVMSASGPDYNQNEDITGIVASRFGAWQGNITGGVTLVVAPDGKYVTRDGNGRVVARPGISILDHEDVLHVFTPEGHQRLSRDERAGMRITGFDAEGYLIAKTASIKRMNDLRWYLQFGDTRLVDKLSNAVANPIDSKIRPILNDAERDALGIGEVGFARKKSAANNGGAKKGAAA